MDIMIEEVITKKDTKKPLLNKHFEKLIQKSIIEWSDILYSLTWDIQLTPNYKLVIIWWLIEILDTKYDKILISSELKNIQSDNYKQLAKAMLDQSDKMLLQAIDQINN